MLAHRILGANQILIPPIFYLLLDSCLYLKPLLSGFGHQITTKYDPLPLVIEYI